MTKFLYESFQTTPEQLHSAMEEAMSDKDEVFFDHALDLLGFEDIANKAMGARSMLRDYREGSAVVTTYPQIIKFLEVADRRYGSGMTFPNVVREAEEDGVPVSDANALSLPYFRLLDDWGMVIRIAGDYTQVLLLETEAREALV